jgi:hypothetical protein
MHRLGADCFVVAFGDAKLEGQNDTNACLRVVEN